jgi:transposase-like protein
LQSLRERGLHGVQLVISDSHLGLKAAIAKVFPGASWQRCRVHYVDNPIMWSCRRIPLIPPRQRGWVI